MPKANLTYEDQLNIRELHAYREGLKAELKGLTNAALADKYDCHIRTIDRLTVRA